MTEDSPVAEKSLHSSLKKALQEPKLCLWLGCKMTPKEQGERDNLYPLKALRDPLSPRPAQQLTLGYVELQAQPQQALLHLREKSGQLSVRLKQEQAIIHKPDEPQVSVTHQEGTHLPLCLPELL